MQARLLALVRKELRPNGKKLRAKGWFYARNHYSTVRRVQRAELLDHQEQEDNYRASGVQQILQALPQAHGA